MQRKGSCEKSKEKESINGQLFEHKSVPESDQAQAYVLSPPRQSYSQQVQHVPWRLGEGQGSVYTE